MTIPLPIFIITLSINLTLGLELGRLHSAALGIPPPYVDTNVKPLTDHSTLPNHRRFTLNPL